MQADIYAYMYTYLCRIDSYIDIYESVINNLLYMLIHTNNSFIYKMYILLHLVPLIINVQNYYFNKKKKKKKQVYTLAILKVVITNPYKC